MIVHATTLALRRDGRWLGVLVRGASGAGKSDLALRALAAGWRLVADDRTHLWRSGGALFARSPATLSGLVEARGFGIATVRPVGFVRLALAVDGLMEPDRPERLPDPQVVRLLQCDLRCIRLRLIEDSALAKVTLALASKPTTL